MSIEAPSESAVTADVRQLVLVVDDNAGMRALITGLLEPVVDARPCADGHQAMAHYEALRPDGVLMDIRMPGMDGIETARRIRAFDPYARIVIVSEVADRATLAAALAAGALACVHKEDLLALPDIVRRYFARPDA